MALHLSRRQILTGLSLGAASALALTGVTVGALEWHQAYLATTRFVERLLSLLPDTRSAARIGATWQQRHPTLFESPEILPLRLAERLKAFGWSGDLDGEDDLGGDAGSPNSLGVVVARIVHDEFQRGDMENIDGWRVSVFQAELCGLAYLVRSQPRAADASSLPIPERAPAPESLG